MVLKYQMKVKNFIILKVQEEMTPITTVIDEIIQREIKIDELSRKREIFSNYFYNIKRHQYELKKILKEGRTSRNRAEFGLEGNEDWFGDAKLHGVNCRRLMDEHEVIINDICDIFIDVNIGIII